MRSFQPPKPRARDYIRPHEAILATTFGLIVAAGAKYGAAAILILWLLAGGQ